MVSFLIPMLFVVLAGILSLVTGIATPLLEILAGIIAANALGFDSTPIIDFLGEFGIIALMYLAGLEIDINFIKKVYKKSIGIGLISFFTPFFTIVLVGYYLLGFTFMQSVLAGIALSSTSVAIVYPILLRSGKLNSTNKALLASAMITDVLGVAILSIFFSHITWYTLITFLFLIIFAGPLRKLGHFFFTRIAKKNSFSLKLKIVLMILLGAQAVAEIAGVEAVLIAFLLGVMTSELIDKFKVIEKELKVITFAFLTPFFFFKVGLSMDIYSLFSGLGYLVLFTLLGYGSHFVGTYVSSRIFLKKKNAFFAGNLFNSKLSIGIITATLGLESGILSGNIYFALVGSLILCTFLSSLLTHEKFTLEG